MKNVPLTVEGAVEMLKRALKEAIPVELILKAGFLAAARLLQPDQSEGCRDSTENQAPGTDRMLPSSQCECG